MTIIRAIWKYYCDVNLINALFSIVLGFVIGIAQGIFAGILWGILAYFSIGVFVGRYAFKIFKNDEYYLYYNLGLTKRKLIQSIYIIHVIIMAPMLIMIYILSLIF